ncbi:MAG: hypothetical protein JXB15_07480 [Anaerolineales bacterium]|nr:hypothetical protein [Anaerolineales bacterium]
MDYEKIVLVTRKTRLEALIERFNTRGQAKFYLEHSGGDYAWYEQEHETYYTALEGLQKSLSRLAKTQVIERSFLPNFLFTDSDLVVTAGIDGLVVNTAKYLSGQPLVAVNPDPTHIDGILLPFSLSQASQAVRRVLSGQAKYRLISMAEVRLNDGQLLLAFNDLFVGARSHVSARYTIQAAGEHEKHSSSGIIISTGAGSTGWLSSLFNMANGILETFGGLPAEHNPPLPPLRLDWEAERLVFIVREPFVSKTSSAKLVCGLITPENPIIIHSEMPEGGAIFSDGIESDYLPFNTGSVATIGLSQRKTRLVVD